MGGRGRSLLGLLVAGGMGSSGEAWLLSELLAMLLNGSLKEQHSFNTWSALHGNETGLWFHLIHFQWPMGVVNTVCVCMHACVHMLTSSMGVVGSSRTGGDSLVGVRHPLTI